MVSIYVIYHIYVMQGKEEYISNRIGDREEPWWTPYLIRCALIKAGMIITEK